MSQEAMSAWVREQFQKANKYLAENEVLFDSVVTAESRYLAPFVAVWKIKDIKNQFYWVISGDLSTDFNTSSVAENAREAMKHFSLSWQLKAENIRRSSTHSADQEEIAQRLVRDAENLYSVANTDKFWLES